MESAGEPPPMSGSTNDPAAGFKNMQPGSEEDFILNVGRHVLHRRLRVARFGRQDDARRPDRLA